VILNPGMTARKMPAPGHALLDIIGDYDKFLCRVANTVEKNHWDPKGDPVQVRPSDETVPGTAAQPHVTSPHRKTDANGKLCVPLRKESVGDVVAESTFDELRERAVEAEAVWRHLVTTEGGVIDDATGSILKRIYRNCDQIKGLMRGEAVHKRLSEQTVSRDSTEAAELPLSADEMITLRKAWEIGVETVVMQTVVQLDGDIVTRIQTGRETAANKSIHDLHRQSVESALAHWQFLGKTLAEFLTSTLRGFLTRR
jgi:hypothetical protein